MNGEDLSAEIKAFIAEHIHSVVELECLLLMQCDPTRQWSAEDLGRELRIDTQWAQREMLDLTRRGLVAAVESAPELFHYRPRTPGQDNDVRALIDAYTNRRVSVIQLIYARPSDPIQSFADAFRLRKGKSDG